MRGYYIITTGQYIFFQIFRVIQTSRIWVVCMCIQLRHPFGFDLGIFRLCYRVTQMVTYKRILFWNYWCFFRIFDTLATELGSFAIWARLSLLSLGPLSVGRLQTACLDV
jgi:hypothetical protein